MSRENYKIEVFIAGGNLLCKLKHSSKIRDKVFIKINKNLKDLIYHNEEFETSKEYLSDAEVEKPSLDYMIMENKIKFVFRGKTKHYHTEKMPLSTLVVEKNSLRSERGKIRRLKQDDKVKIEFKDGRNYKFTAIDSSNSTDILLVNIDEDDDTIYRVDLSSKPAVVYEGETNFEFFGIVENILDTNLKSS